MRSASASALAEAHFTLERSLLRREFGERRVAAEVPDPDEETRQTLGRLAGKIAEALGLGADVVEALIARAVAARSLPIRLIEELSSTTGLSVDQLRTYFFGYPPAQALCPAGPPLAAPAPRPLPKRSAHPLIAQAEIDCAGQERLRAELAVGADLELAAREARLVFRAEPREPTFAAAVRQSRRTAKEQKEKWLAAEGDYDEGT